MTTATENKIFIGFVKENKEAPISHVSSTEYLNKISYKKHLRALEGLRVIEIMEYNQVQTALEMTLEEFVIKFKSLDQKENLYYYITETLKEKKEDEEIVAEPTGRKIFDLGDESYTIGKVIDTKDYFYEIVELDEEHVEIHKFNQEGYYQKSWKSVNKTTLKGGSKLPKVVIEQLAV